jgi:GT2 family glycosyltransferase
MLEAMSQSATSSVTVIICAFTLDRWEALRAAVDSVHRQANPLADVVVVIDYNDELLRRAAATFDGDTVIANVEQQGLSGARNTGVDHASGEIVAFLDDDAAALPGWLERLLAPYGDPSVMGVGGAALPNWQQPPPAWFPPEFYWVVGCSYVGLPTVAAEVRNFIGANMSYRRAAFELVGGFSHGLGRIGSVPLGCEETEFGIRVRRAAPGSRFVYEPDAEVQHVVGASRATWGYFRRRCWAEGLSKAIVAELSGSEAALQSERIYVRRALPLGLRDSLRAGPAGVTRAAAIIAGLLITAAGYARGRQARAR